MAKPLTIAIVSDVVCPWCYLGKRRLERALAELDRPAEIQWLPYELNPDMPQEGMERGAYREAKFGAERAAQYDAQLTALGEEEGVPFAFGRQARTPNTRRAHQLIAFAASEGKSDAVVEALFKAYFEDGRDVGDEEVLGDIAAASGIDRRTALMAIRDTGLASYVADLERQAGGLGIQGVPFFIVDQTWAISGAQAPEQWVAAIRERSGEAGA
ncbi:MAG TPA: DsbA family oxidoreductase [Microvirga sp.]|jgi:predicted DsbA family dithiol-disulfide isomerase|nr:DsbA family oxidoreductase [Microvirga sp.]